MVNQFLVLCLTIFLTVRLCSIYVTASGPDSAAGRPICIYDTSGRAGRPAGVCGIISRDARALQLSPQNFERRQITAYIKRQKTDPVC